MYLRLQVFLCLIVNVEDDLDPDFTVNQGTKCFIHTQYSVSVTTY